MRKLALIAVLSLLAACKNIQNKDAVQLGLNDYLKARQLNVDSMKVEITSLVFSPDGAQAQTTVTFTPKQGGGGMTMPYILDKKDNKWVVRAHTDGENPHGGVVPGAAPGGANPHGGKAMPPLPPLPDKQ